MISQQKLFQETYLDDTTFLGIPGFDFHAWCYCL